MSWNRTPGDVCAGEDPVPADTGLSPWRPSLKQDRRNLWGNPRSLYQRFGVEHRVQKQKDVSGLCWIVESASDGGTGNEGPAGRSPTCAPLSSDRYPVSRSSLRITCRSRKGLLDTETTDTTALDIHSPTSRGLYSQYRPVEPAILEDFEGVRNPEIGVNTIFRYC